MCPRGDNVAQLSPGRRPRGARSVCFQAILVSWTPSVVSYRYMRENATFFFLAYSATSRASSPAEKRGREASGLCRFEPGQLHTTIGHGHHISVTHQNSRGTKIERGVVSKVQVSICIFIFRFLLGSPGYPFSASRSVFKLLHNYLALTPSPFAFAAVLTSVLLHGAASHASPAAHP